MGDPFPPSFLVKVEFIICGAILMAFESQYVHMFTLLFKS